MIALDVCAERITGALLPATGSGTVEQWHTRSDRSRDDVIDTVLNCADFLAGQAARAGLTVTRAGLALPRRLPGTTGGQGAPAAPGWSEALVEVWMSEHLDLPVTVVQRLESAALAEAHFGAGFGCERFVYLGAGGDALLVTSARPLPRAATGHASAVTTLIDSRTTRSPRYACHLTYRLPSARPGGESAPTAIPHTAITRQQPGRIVVEGDKEYVRQVAASLRESRTRIGGGAPAPVIAAPLRSRAACLGAALVARSAQPGIGSTGHARTAPG
ncbi:hypothetical protein [Kitasatospora sp. NPDC057015]|uniref:hypothetical protein n=1 Tax=Kitasatospora sp. NPDC057015 TaxID=3346001 RepID=UPI0036417C55